MTELDNNNNNSDNTSDNTSEEFLKTADAIGTQICRQAFWSDFQCNWMGKDIEDATSMTNIKIVNRALGPELYEGTSGISLFLSYLYSFTKNEEYRKTAEAAIKQSLSHTDDIYSFSRFGLYSGHIGIAYAATKVGVIFHNDKLMEQALDILRNLALINSKEEHWMDIITGNAGAIPSLLEMYDIFQEQIIFDLALQLGNELLESAIKESIGWSWDSKANSITNAVHNLTGFSHGAAGIGYSLLELFNKTDNLEYRRAAENAFAYENHWFSTEHGNWPDFRSDPRVTGSNSQEQFSYALAWCHGAPGIGLSRLRAYQILNEEKYLKDSKAALHTLSKAVENVNDDKATKKRNFSLCHGLSGNCELFIYAKDILGDHHYKLKARDVGIYGIEEYMKKGLAWPCGLHVADATTPGLMLGLAGIGYFYLRLHNSQKIPPIVIILP